MKQARITSFDACLVTLSKLELRDLQEQQKKQEEQNHYEKLVVNALTTWNKEILPNWDNMYVDIINPFCHNAPNFIILLCQTILLIEGRAHCYSMTEM